MGLLFSIAHLGCKALHYYCEYAADIPILLFTKCIGTAGLRPILQDVSLL